MNSVNPKNLTFMVLFVVLLAITFSYVFIYHHGGETIYTDISGLEIED